jgi:tagatose 1,6-diphosphate aldolase
LEKSIKYPIIISELLSTDHSSDGTVRMKRISPGKIRKLQRCSCEDGALVILSIDHRSSLRSLLQQEGMGLVDDDQLISFKEVVVRTLGPEASAILLDPEYGAGQLITRSSLPKSPGLILALESSGFTGSRENRTSQVLAGWNVAKAARLGAEAIRLLVYYHPEADSAPAIESLVDSVAQECTTMDLPLFLAALPYSTDPQEKRLSPDRHREAVLETARILTAIQGVDVYMSEFPLDVNADPDKAHWESACDALSHASRAPWLLISSAVDFDVFLKMSETACRQGASGAAAGRAAWQEAAAFNGAKQADFLQKTCRSRLSQLMMICNSAAVPWTDFYQPVELPADWYLTYPGINHAD